MHLRTVDLEIQREPFLKPFGFKGSAFYEKWNAVVRLAHENRHTACGVGGLAVLWSDAEVFAAHTETGGNLLMLALLEYALQLVDGREFDTPADMMHGIIDEVHQYGISVTRQPQLRRTFTLNALVALDHAAWRLYSRVHGLTGYDELIPADVQHLLRRHSPEVAAIPLVSYNTSEAEIHDVLSAGAPVIKVKIGHPGTQKEMLARDMQRLSDVYNVASEYETPVTESGGIAYYLDANGRYRHRDHLARLLEHAERLGMLEKILILEEPFAEELQFGVTDLPVRVAADESVHSPEDVARRAQQGYSALAVKPAGKTLSMAFEMVKTAGALGMPCYVADNACVPALVEWNKNFAARLAPFPGLRCNMMETNGAQMYGRWEQLLQDLPHPEADWRRVRAGLFHLDASYYAASGGILCDPQPYAGLLQD